MLIPMLHEGADGSGCRVELGDLVLLNDGPETPSIRVEGRTLKLQAQHPTLTGLKCTTKIKSLLRFMYDRSTVMPYLMHLQINFKNISKLA